MEELKNPDIRFLTPFLPFEKKALVETLLELPEFQEYHFTKKELEIAATLAEQEYQKCKVDIRAEGQKALSYMQQNHVKGIVLAGRP